MPFPFGGALGAMGLGQFGRGGQMTIPGYNPGATANREDPPPPVGVAYDPGWQARYDEWRQRNGGLTQQQWHQQNPYNPVEHEAQLDQMRPGWRQEFPQTPQQPQGMPGGYGGAPMPDPQRMPPVPGQPTTGPSYDDYVRGGGGIMPPMGQGQMPGGLGPNPIGYGANFNPTQMRHQQWVAQRGGMAPLSQYPQFGQGGGWGGFGGALGSAFGMRR